MATKYLLYRLLHDALIEMRMFGNESGDRRIYLLADLFHNVPLQLAKVDGGELSPDDVMHWLRERAQRHGIEEWLELRAEDEVKRGHDTERGAPPMT